MRTTPSRRLGLELVFVVLVSLIVMVPGIGGYSLVDPWETHYGEVARNMLADHDLVHMQWPGTNAEGAANEGFRSKPVLTFWMIAAGMKATGVGNYSGSMAEDARTMIAIRLPFILSAIAGLTLMWFMLARLVNRRLAWLALLVVGTCPFFCLIARQGIPDMPLVACTMGALALFALAVEDGDRPIETRWRIRGFPLDARHVVLGLAGGFVVIQALYYAVYFMRSPQLAIPGRVLNPSLWLPLVMLLGLGALSQQGWLILRLPFILIGGIVHALVGGPAPARGVFGHLAAWERYSPDRYVIRALAYPVAWAGGEGWPATNAIADRLLVMAPLKTMRQVYLLGCYSLLGVSILAKGPPGIAVVGAVGVFHVVLLNKWEELYKGGFELKRGLLLMLVTFLPWHLAMWLKDGIGFINEYLFTHILNRAAVGSVDKSFGTFEYYTSQLGHGMWLWAALLPAAIGAALVRSRLDTREGRVRFMVAMWAIVAMAFFCIVQTKFHHYILPAVPALGILVAFLLDDIFARRERLHPVYAGIGIGIVLLVCRDLMHEPDRWIEMFVYRYDRPWPSAEPWAIDPSDGFLALGLIAAGALALAATRFARLGVVAIGAAGLAICIWSLQVYMPIAGKHWGMGDAMHAYFEQRTVYGDKLVYYSPRQLHDAWVDTKDTWSFDTYIPEGLQLGQPMTLTVELDKPEGTMEKSIPLVGTATSIGTHSVEVTLAPGERAKLGALIAQGATGAYGDRMPTSVVDADRLIAWQLYWRGEQFWSGGEIWGGVPELKTTFPATNNVDFLKYLNDHARAPLGRRYFIVTEAGRITSVRPQLPTPRARDTFEVLETSSNKFSLAAFYL
jgi:4-amino-4-deoxy-L-arabinose transferase-like glycosyltransferase